MRRWRGVRSHHQLGALSYALQDDGHRGRVPSSKTHAGEIWQPARTFIPHARSGRLEQRLGELASRKGGEKVEDV